MIDRRRLLGGLSMYVRIHHNDRPMSLIGGYQGMFVSITMIDRLSLLGGGLSKYICIYHNDGPTSLIRGLFRSLEFRPLLFMIDRRRLLGGLSKHIHIYHNDGPTSLVCGLSRALEFRPL